MTRLLSVWTAAVCLCMHGCGMAGKEPPVDIPKQQLEHTITTLRGAYAAFNRGDIDAAVAPLDEHIEWSEPAEFPGGGTYYGREGARQYLSRSRTSLAEGTSEPVEFIPAGDKVVVFVHAHVRPRGSEWLTIDLADVYTVREGKLVAMHAFADRQEALRWAGASSAKTSADSKE